KAMTDAMRKGTALKLTATSIQNTAVPLTVSLKGFGAALDRASALVAAR
ncbi:invasion associated locus B family protein, partial [Brucella intermedia]